MKETAFLKQNEKKWLRYESLLEEDRKSIHPDELASLYIEVTDDLSYAKTHYPESKTTQYLNQIAAKLHSEIYKNKKERKFRFISFWREEVPLVMADNQRNLFFSFLIFAVGVLMGAVSTANDASFARLILQDRYVNMTLANIEKDNPMAVYESMSSDDMFAAITINNIRVSFIAFIGGLSFSVLTVWALWRNGVMLGTFHVFLAQNKVLGTSLVTVYIHGTLEISAIIIAGSAGLLMGKALLFPKTRKRSEALLIAAKKGIKIIIGLVPVFIMAGFLESFVTRFGDGHIGQGGLVAYLTAINIGMFFISFYAFNKRTFRIFNAIAWSLYLIALVLIFTGSFTGMEEFLQRTNLLNFIVIILSFAFIAYYFVIYPILLKSRLKLTDGKQI